MDGLEQGVVEASGHGRSGLEICGVAVAGEPDGGPKHILPALEVALRRLQLVLGRLLRDADAVLIRLQQLEWDRARVLDARLEVDREEDRLACGDGLFATEEGQNSPRYRRFRRASPAG